MAGAVGIVFGLCVLSFTMGAALMYVVLRRREDAASPSVSSPDEPAERTWVEKPGAVEPVDDDYDSRPIHRNPVMGLRQMEPALAVLAEPVVEAGPVEAEPEPVAEVESEVESEPEPEPVAEVEPEAEPVTEVEPEPEPVAEVEPETVLLDEHEPEPEPAPQVVVETVAATGTLPPPATPQPVEHTTWVEREDFRQRYLRTFEEVRRKADSN